MAEFQNVVTIDGPSGVGKSTVSRKVASATGFTYLDTGAMYRAVGLYLTEKKVKLDNDTAILHALELLKLELIPAEPGAADIGVIVNGKTVSEIIRTPEMAMVASKVSALPVVRDYLTAMQRNLGEKGAIVAEGRDTGTVVFPRAAYKFYLDAVPEIRAERRFRQLKAKGCEADFQEILTMTRERDRNDSTRTVAPLKKADDAILVDTSDMNAGQVAEVILQEIERKR